MIAIVRRAASPATLELLILFLAFSAFVAGLGVTVRGAEMSAFLPAALPAAFVGWWLGHSKLKPWPAIGTLTALGAVFVWARSAQLFSAAQRLATITSVYLLEAFLYLRGRFEIIDTNTTAAIETAIRDLLAQSTAVWMRLEDWLAGVWAGKPVSDLVVLVLVWSLLIWLLAGWAGWEVGRRRPLAGLVPGLAVLAGITKYTNADATALWLMAVCLLGLISLSGYETNMRRWATERMDYAELVVLNTMFSAVLLTLMIAVLGYVLPTISVKDILESMRRHDPSENQAAQSLGLEAARVPATAVPAGLNLYRAARLPNNHLLGSGPELSRDVIFTVQTGEFPPIPVLNVQGLAPRHYWRSYSFDFYTGSGWVSSPAQDIKSPAGKALFDIPAGYRLLKQEFNLKHGEEGSLYWSGTLYRSDLPFEAAWRIPPGQAYPAAVDPFRGADLYGALNSSAHYQVESLLPAVSVDQLRATGRQYPDFIQQRYTHLPASVPERVYALARKLTGTATSPYDEALAIESYLRKNYPYSLDVPLPPTGVDVADYFLFDLKKGYCDYYATTMVVLARSVGLPARFVMGYSTGTYNPPTAEYIVTAADAHAWVEVYFPGIGWVEFEPTASQPEIIRSTAGASAPHSEAVPAQQWGKLVRSIYSLPPVTRGVTAGVVGVLVLVGILFLLEGWFLGLARPVFALRWMYRSIYRQGGRLAGPPEPSQTASEFSERLQAIFNKTDPRLDMLTGYYLSALFSPRSVERLELQRAIRAWRGLRWKLFWTRKPGKPPVK